MPKRLRTVLATAGVLCVIAGGGAALANAASSGGSGSNSQSQSTQTQTQTNPSQDGSSQHDGNCPDM
jgi:hypothetical protein